MLDHWRKRQKLAGFISNRHIYLTKSEESSVAQYQIYCKCTAGKARNLWGAAKDMHYLQKKKTEQSYPDCSYTVLTYAMTGAITHTNLRKICDSAER